MNDDHIYHLILGGDQDGLSMLLDKYGGLITYIAKNIGHLDNEDLYECISDILLAVWRRIGNYNKDKSSFKSWIMLVTRGCTIDYIRKLMKDDKVVHLEDMTGEFAVYDGFDSLDIDRISELLNRLSPPDNEIFYRRFILGETVSIIARALNITKESIYKRISRGRDKLRMIMDKEGYYVD